MAVAGHRAEVGMAVVAAGLRAVAQAGVAEAAALEAVAAAEVGDNNLPDSLVLDKGK